MNREKIKYSELSDFEINELVARKTSDYLGPIGDWFPDGVKVRISKGLGYFGMDYCKKASDAWPIIVENNICISPHYSCENPTRTYEHTGMWCAEMFDFQSEQVTDKNPLRAAMIAYLMMQDKEQ